MATPQIMPHTGTAFEGKKSTMNGPNSQAVTSSGNNSPNPRRGILFAPTNDQSQRSSSDEGIAVTTPKKTKSSTPLPADRQVAEDDDDDDNLIELMMYNKQELDFSKEAWVGLSWSEKITKLCAWVFVTFEVESSSQWAKVISVLLKAFIVMAIVCYILSTEPSLRVAPVTCEYPDCDNDPILCPGYQICQDVNSPPFETIETICIAVFTIDYGVRLLTVWAVSPMLAGVVPSSWVARNVNDPLAQPPQYSTFVKVMKYIFLFKNLVDLASILPGYVGMFIEGAGSSSFVRVLRLLRLIRILRLLRLLSWLKNVDVAADLIMEVLNEATLLLSVFMFLVVIVVIIFGCIIFIVEGGSFTVNEAFPDGAYLRPLNDGLGSYEISPFTSVATGMYWAIGVATGSVDFQAKSVAGRAIANVLCFVGVFGLAFPVGVIGSELEAAKQRSYRRLLELSERKRQAMRHSLREGLSGSKDRLPLDASRSGKWEALRTLADKVDKTGGQSGLGGMGHLNQGGMRKPSFMGAVLEAARADGEKARRRKRVLMLMLQKAREMRRAEAAGGRGAGWQERQLVGMTGGFAGDGDDDDDGGSDYGIELDENGVELAASKDARERRELHQLRTQGYTASPPMSVLVAGAAARGGGSWYGGVGGTGGVGVGVGYAGRWSPKSAHRSSSLSSIPVPARYQSSSAGLDTYAGATGATTTVLLSSATTVARDILSGDIDKNTEKMEEIHSTANFGTDATDSLLEGATVSDKLSALIAAAWADLQAAQARLRTSEALVKGSAEDVGRYDARLRALVGLVKDVESIRGDVAEIAAAGRGGSEGGGRSGEVGASGGDLIPVPLLAASNSPRVGDHIGNSASSSGSNSGQLQPLKTDLIPPIVTPPPSLPRPPRSSNSSGKADAPPSPLPQR